MRAFDLFLGALALFSRVASQPSPPPTCTNLTGWWCCQPTNLTQVGSSISTVGPAYGNGTGTITGSVMSIQFTNQPSGVLLNGTLSPDCSTVSWDNGGEWTRSISPPWTGPAVPAPAWAYGLSILEVNALAYTSPNGTGSLGDGSGTWAALTERVPFWQSLGIEGIWLAYFSLSTAHFYGIRSVYGCLDPAQLEPCLGTATEFKAFIDACHAAGIYVFLDVIGHGLVNQSHYIAEHPEWFLGGSWGMTDYNYDSAGFVDWWASVWTSYVTTFGVDGFRVDCGVVAWWPAMDRIVLAAHEAGHDITVFGEGDRYHFSQHDLISPPADIAAAALSAAAAGHCLSTLQFSCHDAGWESPPGNYFFILGSRAQFGNGALSPFIPLWFGGEEYNEDPVIDLPSLQEDLYGTSGKPGGWMYGTVRQWDQVTEGAHAAMLADTTAILAIRAAHADVLHRNVCSANITELALSPGSPALSHTPYVRWLSGSKAVLVLANAAPSPAAVGVFVPLDTLGMGGAAFLDVTILYGGQGGVTRYAAGDLEPLALNISGDGAAGGGLIVMLVEPVQ